MQTARKAQSGKQGAEAAETAKTIVEKFIAGRRLHRADSAHQMSATNTANTGDAFQNAEHSDQKKKDLRGQGRGKKHRP